jgi:hypothetical protein
MYRVDPDVVLILEVYSKRHEQIRPFAQARFV